MYICGMKKYTYIFAVIAIVAMTACGNGSNTTTEQTDSLSTKVDSTAVTATDSTTAQIPTNDSVAKPATEVK